MSVHPLDDNHFDLACLISTVWHFRYGKTPLPANAAILKLALKYQSNHDAFKPFSQLLEQMDMTEVMMHMHITAYMVADDDDVDGGRWKPTILTSVQSDREVGHYLTSNGISATQANSLAEGIMTYFEHALGRKLAP